MTLGWQSREKDLEAIRGGWDPLSGESQDNYLGRSKEMMTNAEYMGWPMAPSNEQRIVDALARLETAALANLALERKRASDPQLRELLNLEFVHMDMFRRINAVREQLFPCYQPSEWTKTL